MELKSKSNRTYKKNEYSVNHYWILLVLVHLLTVVVATGMNSLPMGNLLLLLMIWLFIDYVLVKNIAYYDIWGKDSKQSGKLTIILAIGCAISFGVLSIIPVAYKASALQKIMLLCFYLFVCWKEIKRVEDNIAIHKPKLIPTLIIVVGFFLVFSIATYVNGISMLFVNNYVADSLSSVRENLLGSIVVSALLPAVVEELLFRGYMMKNISNQKVAVVVSALTFACLHCNFNQMAYAFVIGILFALVIVYTDNILYSMGLHFLFNLVNVLLAWVPQSSPINRFFESKILGYPIWNPQFRLSSGAYDVKMILFGAVITVIAIVIFILLLKLASGYCVKTEETSRDGNWSPDLLFFLGCGICLLLAFLREISG